MILALLAFISSLIMSSLPNDHYEFPKVSEHMKFSMFISLILMFMHKVESYYTREWTVCRFYSGLKKISFLQEHGEIVFLVFCTTFLLSTILMLLMICYEQWIHYNLLIWGCQLINETHHISKAIMRKAYYSGSYSAVLLVLWANLHYFPYLGIMYDYDWTFVSYLVSFASIVCLTIFCIEVWEVPKRKFRSILITGGGRGIGAELMEMFASENTFINICGRERRSLEKIKRKCEIFGADVMISDFDISDKEKLKSFISTANNRRALDLVICNACCKGTEKQQSDVNLVATIDTINQSMNILQKRSVIAVMSSLGIFQNTPNDHFYMAIKSALYHYSKSIIPLGLQKKIKIVTVCPGMARPNASLFSMTYKQAAEIIHNGLICEKDFIIFPMYQWIGLRLFSILPMVMQANIIALFMKKDLNNIDH